MKVERFLIVPKSAGVTEIIDIWLPAADEQSSGLSSSLKEAQGYLEVRILESRIVKINIEVSELE